MVILNLRSQLYGFAHHRLNKMACTYLALRNGPIIVRMVETVTKSTARNANTTFMAFVSSTLALGLSTSIVISCC